MAKANQASVEETVVEDLINHPSHYQALDDSDIECCKALRAMLGIEGYIAHLKGNIFEYNWRLGRKAGEAEKDAGKIGWYAAELSRVLEEFEVT